MKIIILGGNGMLGHVVSIYFKQQNHKVCETTRNQSSKYYYDAYKNVYEIENLISKIQPDAIINCIGILNQTAESNHALAIMANSFLPNYIDSLSDKYHFKFVHVSTDCVFDGKKGNYSESSIPNSTSFYGISKAMGEINNNRSLTLRTSIVGPDNNPKGIGLFQWFSTQTGEVKGYSEVYWTGVTTMELARIIEIGIKQNLTGLHHVVNNSKIKKSDLLKLFNDYFNFDNNIVEDPSYKSDKSLIRTAESYDFDIPDYPTLIKQMYNWVNNHPKLYPQLIERMHQK